MTQNSDPYRKCGCRKNKWNFKQNLNIDKFEKQKLKIVEESIKIYNELRLIFLIIILLQTKCTNKKKKKPKPIKQKPKKTFFALV